MSSIVRRTIKGQVYLYESTSYRDKSGRPRNNQVCIGKIDPITGKPVYNEKYRQRLIQSGDTVQQRFSIQDIQRSTLKEVGAFLKSIADDSQSRTVRIGLKIPKHYHALLWLSHVSVSCSS